MVLGWIWSSSSWWNFSLLIKSNENYVNILGILGVLIFLIPTILDRGFGVSISMNYRYLFGIIGGIILIISIIMRVTKKKCKGGI